MAAIGGAFRFNYKASPTCRRFHRSNARVRAILGPVGCLPCETEVMTPGGWVRIDEWRGQEILQWDSGSGEARFIMPKRHIRAECGGMLMFDAGGRMRMTVTPNHRVPVYDWSGRFRVVSALDLACHLSKHTVPTSWASGERGCGLSVQMVRVWVMICADGSYPKAGRQCVVTVRRERKVERAKELLDAAGIPYSVSVRDRDGVDETSVVFARPSLPNHFDWRLSRCSEKEAEAFVDELAYWDGLYGHDYDRYSTSVKQDADIVQFMCHTVGRNATVSRYHDSRSEKWADMYNVYPAKIGSRKNRVMIRCDNTKVSDVKPSDGMQYCFETDTGFFVVRQNGNVFITGNSGKSSAIIAGEVMKRAMEQEPDLEGRRKTRVVMIRNTYNELTTTTLRTFREWMGDVICTYRSDKPLSANIRFPMSDGTRVECEVIFLAMDKPEDVGKLRSLEVTWGYINEASEITDYEIFDALNERIGRYPKKWENEKGEKCGGATWCGICIDSNAPDDEHWIYQKFEVERPRGFEIFHQPPAVLLKEGTTPENPEWEANVGQCKDIPAAENIENIPTGWEYYMNMIPGKPYEKIRVMLQGEYGTVAYGRPVFPEYRDQIYYLPNKKGKDGQMRDVDVLRGIPLLIGIDPGIRHSAFVIAQLSPMRQLRIVEDCLLNDASTPDMVNIILAKLRNEYNGMDYVARCDPAGMQRGRTDGRYDFEVMNEMGFKVTPCVTNSSKERIESVKWFMRQLVDGEPGLVVGTKAPWIRKGFAGRYYYKKISTGGRDEMYKNEPVKNEYSHPMDGLQYIAASLRLESEMREAATMVSSTGFESMYSARSRQQLPSAIDTCGIY